MHTTVAWAPWDAPGMEHLALRQSDSGIEAESTVLGIEDGQPFTLRYRLNCDRLWRVRSLVAETPQGWARVDIRSDGDGNWTDPAGSQLSKLHGCIDVDIVATPFTNTLPIRRLRLEQGASREISVVYLSVPPLEVAVAMQRYSCLETGKRYRFESLDDGQTVFRADLPVDADGLVLDYPGLFRRVELPKEAHS